LFVFETIVAYVFNEFGGLSYALNTYATTIHQ